MAQYIDKAAVVAEIERMLETVTNASTENSRELAAIQGAQQCVLIKLIQYLDTIKVKEVDLKKELVNFDFMGCNDARDIRNVAKHFFELGLSVSNPTTAADRGMAEEIIFNLKRLEEDYCISLTKEKEWLRQITKKENKLWKEQ